MEERDCRGETRKMEEVNRAERGRERENRNVNAGTAGKSGGGGGGNGFIHIKY